MSDVSPSVFIGASIKVLLCNSRILSGILTVIDPFGNLLLSEVIETSQDLLDNSEHTRELGLVSVPRLSVKKIVVNKKTYRQLGLEKLTTGSANSGANDVLIQ